MIDTFPTAREATIMSGLATFDVLSSEYPELRRKIAAAIEAAQYSIKDDNEWHKDQRLLYLLRQLGYRIVRHKYVDKHGVKQKYYTVEWNNSIRALACNY